jgi:hypothetical protein
MDGIRVLGRIAFPQDFRSREKIQDVIDWINALDWKEQHPITGGGTCQVSMWDNWSPNFEAGPHICGIWT